MTCLKINEIYLWLLPFMSISLPIITFAIFICICIFKICCNISSSEKKRGPIFTTTIVLVLFLTLSFPFFFVIFNVSLFGKSDIPLFTPEDLKIRYTISWEDYVTDYNEYCNWDSIELFVEHINKISAHDCQVDTCDCNYMSEYNLCDEIILNTTTMHCNYNGVICCEYIDFEDSTECYEYNKGTCNIKCEENILTVVDGWYINPENEELEVFNFTKICTDNNCANNFIGDYGYVGSNFSYGYTNVSGNIILGELLEKPEININVYNSGILLVCWLIIAWITIIIMIRYYTNVCKCTNDSKKTTDIVNQEIEIPDIIESEKIETPYPNQSSEKMNSDELVDVTAVYDEVGNDIPSAISVL